MFLTSLSQLVLRKNQPPKRGRRPAGPKGTYVSRLWLEGLEDRLLLSTIRWTNPAGGDWDTAANWDLNRVPVAADDAVIDTAGITVTHGVGTSDAVHSITSQAALVLSGQFDGLSRCWRMK